jgi:tetrapyrrole methylase family protein/MazG family protein
MSRFSELVEVVRRLRAPGGCPWDREQTPATLRPYVIEEAYEVVDAIDSDDAAALCDELGDLLLQVVLHAAIAAESGRFTIEDVIAGLIAKMVRRHPHVFGDVVVSDAAEVVRNWTRIKAEERRAADPDTPTSALGSLPRELPALHAADRTGEKAARVGFDWPAPAGALAKAREELDELEQALGGGDAAAIEHELGDALFALASTGRLAGQSAEMALRAALTRFEARFRRMEAALRAQGREMQGASPTELDALWEAAKAAESDG